MNNIGKYWIAAGGVGIGIALQLYNTKDATYVPANIAKDRESERRRAASFYLIAGALLIFVGTKGFDK